MELIKYHFALTYYPLTFLMADKRTTYELKVFEPALEIIKRNKYNSFTKNFLYTHYKEIEKELHNFILANKDLKTKELTFFRNLYALTKNIKRYIVHSKAKMFPGVYTELTVMEFEAFLADYAKNYKLKHLPNVKLIQDRAFRPMVAGLWLQASQFADPSPETAREYR